MCKIDSKLKFLCIYRYDNRYGKSTRDGLINGNLLFPETN